jgi:VCBS repeat protein/FG-GAP repeat protein
MSRSGVVTTTRCIVLSVALVFFSLPMGKLNAIAGSEVISPTDLISMTASGTRGRGISTGWSSDAATQPMQPSEVGCSGVSFAQGPAVPTGSDPTSIVAGDLNRDGKPDLAVSNSSSNNVNIFLGNGNGGLTEPPGSPIALGTQPGSIAIGDFNLDGKPDLAASNRLSNDVTILLGDANGGFSQPPGSPISVSLNPSKVAVGDFNLDGKPDLAVTNAGSDNVTVLLGNGSGGFAQAGSPVATGSAPVFEAVGDFNRDGNPDLAVANSSDNVTILLGNGTGEFAEAVGSPVAVGDAPGSVAVGDFNRDGNPDLAVTNFGQLQRPLDNTALRPSVGPGTGVSILAGDGNGGFSQSGFLAAGDYPINVVAADFNMDGKADLAVSNASFLATGFLAIRLGDGNGGFTVPAGSPVGAFPFRPVAVVVSDFNLDGRMDLAGVTPGVNANNVILQINTCASFPCAGISLAQPGAPVAVGSGPQSTAIGDFNLDGKPDLAAANFDSNNVTILLGDGMGAFAEPGGSPVAVGTGPSSVAAGDFNLDGKPDLAVANYRSFNVSILLGNGMGGFAQPANSPISGLGPSFLTVCDFNLDGKPDLAVANINNGKVSISLGDGLAGFVEAAGSPITVGTDPAFLAVGDFNRDGKPDLAAAITSDNNVTILIGNGAGGFTQAPGSPVGAGTHPYSVATGDFNLDGKPDLAMANFGSNNVTIRLGNGAGGFLQTFGSPVSAGSFPICVAVGDFNLDGRPDLAVANFAPPSNDVTILRGNGSGGFIETAGPPRGSGVSPQYVTVGDFNMDGRSDLAVPNRSTNDVTILLNICSNTLAGTDTIGLFRSSGNSFFLRNSNTPGFPDISVSFGASGDIPVTGDWDGNGTVTIGIYRPSDSTFYLRNSNTFGFPDLRVPFGDGPGGDLPVVGDWNGDGVTTIGVYRPNTSTFYLRNSNATGFPDLSVPYGAPGDLPVVGDWDGSGTTTIGVYRPGGSVFYLRNSNTIGFPDLSIAYGAAGDLPLVGDWDGNGSVTVGVYRPTGSIFYLRNSNTTGFPDLSISYGAPGDKPLAGDWDGQ